MSSDPGGSPPRNASPAPSVPQAGEVVLQGNLHPAVLLLRLFDGIRQAVLPTFFGVIAEPVFLAVGAAVFLLHVGYGLLRYLTFQYTLTTEELRTREGVLHRQERRIPIDRIQDVGFESTILRRALGLAVVRVETASGQGVEAALDSLSRADAEGFRELLLSLRSARASVVASPLCVEGTSPSAVPVPQPEWTVFVVDAGMLLLRGLSDLRFGAMVVAAYGAYEIADQLGLVTRLQGVGDSFYGWLSQFPWFVAAGVLLALVAAALALSATFAAIGNLLAFHGFRLTLRQDALSCRFGFLTTRQKTLPRTRIQRVRVEQTWLRRLLGVAVLRADSAGSGRGVDEEAPGGFDVLAPLARTWRIDAMLPAALPGLERADGAVHRASPRLVARLAARGIVEAALAAAALWPFHGAAALLALGWAPISWIRGMLLWHGIAFALFEEHLYLKSGVVGSYQVFVPTTKVQAVSLRRGPIQRALGLAEVAVFVAGGPPTRVPDLDLDTARRLCADLADRAASAALLDWRSPAV